MFDRSNNSKIQLFHDHIKSVTRNQCVTIIPAANGDARPIEKYVANWQQTTDRHHHNALIPLHKNTHFNIVIVHLLIVELSFIL